MFVYKHIETIECVKKYYSTFKEKHKLYERINRGFLGNNSRILKIKCRV